MMKKSICAQVLLTGVMSGVLLSNPAWANPPDEGQQPFPPKHGLPGGGREHQQPGGPNQGPQGDHGRFRSGVSEMNARQFAHDAGVRGYKPLPPGMRRRFMAGRPIPPGVDMRPVPPELLHRLPAHPGYEWRVAGSDLVLVAVSTAIVTEVLSNVLR